MLPGICPVTIVYQITNSITSQIFPSITGQQIFPRTIIITIRNGVQLRAQRTGCIVVLLLCENIASVVIGVDPRLACCLIVLTGQLAKTVIDICSGRTAIGDRSNIPTGIVGVGIGGATHRPLVDLCTCGSCAGILIGDVGGHNRLCSAFGRNASHTAVGIIGIICTLTIRCCLFQPIIVVVGVACGISGTIQYLGLRS